MIEYHPTNYRSNLITYWRQFYSNWTIPKGYHVHHIKPKCTFEDKNDPRIHHPKNLIALHIDDHVTIHECRGDKLMRNLTPIIMSMKGRKRTPEATKKFKVSMAVRKENSVPRKKISDQGRKNMAAGQKLRAPKTEAAINNWRDSMAQNKANGYVRKPKPHSEETKRKLRIAAQNRKVTPAVLEGRIRASEKKRGRKLDPSHCKKISDGNKGKKMTAECIAKRVATRKKNKENGKVYKKAPDVQCIHCQIICCPGNYKKYHGDKCKQKN